ncbi:DUF4139 domain-containing protein [Yoonia sp.]|uniref:DUF4139 domain-containing protein n=1 Tax=Yoonia sp. TaxID=2212373 RepID=UPI00391C0101
MFRLLLTTSVMALSAPAFADTITGQARVDSVTIYPGLASVTRQVTLDLPEGQHEVIIPGLPQNLRTDGVRIAAPGQVRLGSVNLAFDRLPVTPDQASPAVQDARAEVERLEEVVRMRDVAIAEIRLRVQAAEDQIAFLQSLGQASAGETLSNATISDIQALAQMVGAETLALRSAAFAAEQEAQAAIRAREDEADALADARRALDALLAPEEQGSVLTFRVDAAEPGEVTFDITTTENLANWSPVYDMRLATGDAPRVEVDRAVVVSQATGQDWLDVQLILSTARPGEQIAPSGAWADLRRIISRADLDRENAAAMGAADMMSLQRNGPMLSAPRTEASPVTAQADFSGAAVTYVYPTRVDIRNGVEELRLPLDQLTFDAEVWAEATPMSDANAYRVAEFTNTTDEILLPGPVMVQADGTMVGFSYLPLLAAGAEMDMGFGPLDGLRLTRQTPSRSEGDVGVFSSATQLVDRTILKVENLTGQDWDVLLRDAVPYSEQDDLEVSLTASPAVTRRDPEGERGIVEWDLRVPAGTEQEVTMEYTLRWPSGYVLR